MNPILIRVNVETDFSEQKAATTNTTAPIPMTRTAGHTEIKDSSAGIWECTPGKFPRHVIQAEFSYIIEGEGTFTNNDGDLIKFRAGDSLYFKANTQGEWHIKETVRKAYFIV